MDALGKLRMDLHNVLRKRAWQAGYQTNVPGLVNDMKRAFLAAYFNGASTSKSLTDRELEAAIKLAETVPIPMNRITIWKRPTDGERRKIVRLGKYVLGALYGEEWFWKHLPDWTESCSRRRVKSIDHLTQDEARYVIRVMEQIEKKRRAA